MENTQKRVDLISKLWRQEHSPITQEGFIAAIESAYGPNVYEFVQYCVFRETHKKQLAQCPANGRQAAKTNECQDYYNIPAPKKQRRRKKMKRNIKKQVAEGEEIARKKARLDLTREEYRALQEAAESAAGEDLTAVIYYAITKAYYAGLAIGYRNGGGKK